MKARITNHLATNCWSANIIYLRCTPICFILAYKQFCKIHQGWNCAILAYDRQFSIKNVNLGEFQPQSRQCWHWHQRDKLTNTKFICSNKNKKIENATDGSKFWAFLVKSWHLPTLEKYSSMFSFLSSWKCPSNFAMPQIQFLNLNSGLENFWDSKFLSQKVFEFKMYKYVLFWFSDLG